MKRFWIKLLLLIPVPLMVIGFNWFVDPVHLRNPDQYESGIANLILQGHAVTNIYNPNEAAFIISYVHRLQTRKDVLVFGSSRSKLIRADSFPGLTLFNNSVSGGGLLDYLAIYQMYHQKHLLPSIAVIELSPWVLDTTHLSVWKTLNASGKELAAQLLSTGRDPEIRFRADERVDLSQFLSLGYFQTSLFSWLSEAGRASAHQNNYFAWQRNTLPLGETLLADGSSIYPERIQNPTEKELVTALAIEYGRNPIVPEAIEPARQRLLEAFLDLLARDGVRAVLYLPPYHPRAYAAMLSSQASRIIVAEQAYFMALARRKRLTIIGSYNPNDESFDGTDFLDGSHPNGYAVRKLFAGCVTGLSVAKAATPADEIELAGINNPNGLEVVDDKPFFWIGKAQTSLNIRSSRAGLAQLSFQAVLGPSLPTSQQCTLLLRTSGDYSKLVQIGDDPQVQVSFPVRAGANQVYLSSLDKPLTRSQSDGDRRVLLLGVSAMQARLLPAGAVLGEQNACTFALTDGWYPIERTGSDWLCWTSRRGRILVVAPRDMTADLSGRILSARRPNQVDVFANGHKISVLKIDSPEWAFHSFGPVKLTLKSGENFVELASHAGPISPLPEKRQLAIAVSNLHFTGNP